MSEVLAKVVGNYGVLTLDREKALNAINHDMILEIRKHLLDWKDDDDIEAVIIQAKGEKAFCAGGDVKAVYEDGLEVKKKTSKGDLIADFFFDEYQLNTLIFNYPKPYIALVNGVCMGGGVGISIHGARRIISENLMLAMPETGIGLFPDVGGSYFLSRAPGYTGLFAGLTGHRMGVADALYIGFATDYMPLDKMQEFVSEIENGKSHTDILDEFSEDHNEVGYLETHFNDIQKHFSHDSLKEILNSLKSEDTDFTKQALKLLNRMSPTSMAMFFEQYNRAMSMTFEEIMVMEYRLSQACMHGHDFFEGIRALLIDKDKNPQWSPKTIDALDNKVIERYFNTVPKKGDLTFL